MTQPEKKPFKHEAEHVFIPRTSYFDTYLENTKISKSEFKGFYNLAIVVILFYIICKPLHNYFNHGFFIRMTLISRMVDDFAILLFVWPLFHLWTYLAFLLQVAILKEWVVSRLAIGVIQHSTQSGIFILTTIISIKSNLCITHMGFTVIQCMIHFFKMHSYTQINRDYREDYLSRLDRQKPSKAERSTMNEKPLPYERLSSYPKNITIGNFLYFLRAPTFIYAESYPRTGSFRLGYFIQKVFLAFISLVLQYHIFTEYIEVTFSRINQDSLISLIFELAMPLLFLCISMFFLVFECVLNGYAELATFADREFYSDWWNSSEFEEFNRKWNKIVHEFLYRHVYLECYKRYGLSKWTSKVCTFLFSAALHEFCIVIVLRLLYPFMLLLMIAQIPFLLIFKRLFKGSSIGNFLFWVFLNLGVNLIFILYNRIYISMYGL